MYISPKQKAFYHFRQGEIPGLDDFEALRREACPPIWDRRMTWTYGQVVIVEEDQDGNVIDQFVGAVGDPRCDLLDEVEKQE